MHSSGVLLLGAAALHRNPAWLSLTSLLASRLVLGVGESLGSTGATLWGITAVGQENTAKVISFNGVATYGALALGAPLGVVMEQQWGLASIGIVTILLCGVSFVLASRKAPVPVVPGEHLPFREVLGRVTPHGISLALGGVGYSVLATFVTLFYASRNWNGAALCLTGFGVAFIAARLLFIRAIGHYGGYPVGITCLRSRVSRRPVAVACGFSLDGLRRCRPRGVWIFAGVSGVGSRGGKTRPRAESRHGARRVHGVRRCLVLSGRPNSRRGHWLVWVRKRVFVRAGLRHCIAGHRGSTGDASRFSVLRTQIGVLVCRKNLPVLLRGTQTIISHYTLNDVA